MTRASRLLALATAAAASLLGVGCNSYHYYDVKIQVDQSSLPLEKAGYMQLCQIKVSGADNDLITLPTTGNGAGMAMPACPFGSNYPVLGTFEYATFADSGKLQFSFSGYDSQPVMDSFLCATGSVEFTAGSTITQMMTLMVTAGPHDCVSQTQQ
ncbi:MAG TPA: hypothetical protein VHO67_15055 [Polyangia bacterium]|nr:hypothetical protein [Polyangia bacterium]